ncbi:MAG TPA: helix-turn-helix transcriptional regulator [Sphingomonas sp.]|nr:helix-turn-helix transcriptional regulator [Sphingomonas sp.]
MRNGVLPSANGSEADLDSLAARALSAALDVTKWREMLATLAPGFAAAAVSFGAVDGAAATLMRGEFIGLDTDLAGYWRDYHERMAADDPHLRHAARGGGARVVTDLESVDPARASDRNFVAWQERQLGVRHHLSYLIDVGQVSVGLGLHRTAATGPATPMDRLRLRALGEQLAPALQLGFVHAELLLDAFWDGLTTGQSKAACLLDDRGTMLRITPPLERILHQQDGLRARADRLEAIDETANARLLAVTGAAITPNAALAGAVVLPRHAVPPAVLSVYPLDRSVHQFQSRRVAALAVLTDPSRKSQTVDLQLQHAFSLTAQEARVAARLADGDDLAAVAALLDISRETVRVHLKKIFQKTGTRRQSELMRLATLLQGRR